VFRVWYETWTAVEAGFRVWVGQGGLWGLGGCMVATQRPADTATGGAVGLGWIYGGDTAAGRHSDMGGCGACVDLWWRHSNRGGGLWGLGGRHSDRIPPLGGDRAT